MKDSQDPLPITLSISAVERDTGLSKDTLRVWERRYGFPQPARDALGERAYTLSEVERLRFLRRLMDAGHRPGRIVGLNAEQLRTLAIQSAKAPQPRATSLVSDELSRFVALLKDRDHEVLRADLMRALQHMGLERFVSELVGPLTGMVGDAWACGDLEVFEEHVYTETIQVVLRHAIGSVCVAPGRPRVLLTTLPNEVHGLGLLMAEAVLALAGCRCLSLGTQTPVWDILRAASSKPVDIVALSFSACLNPNVVVEGLAELRAKLPTSTELWAGGRCPVLRRRPPGQATVFSELSDIGAAVRRWREARSDGHPGADARQATNSDSTPV